MPPTALHPAPPRSAAAGPDQARGYRPLLAYSIVANPEDGTAAWVRCGVARHQPDGTLLVRLDAYPRNGEVLLRDPTGGQPAPQRLPPPVPPPLPPTRRLDS